MILTKHDKQIITVIAICFGLIGFGVARFFMQPNVIVPVDFTAKQKHRDDSLTYIITIQNRHIDSVHKKMKSDSIITLKKYHEIINFTPAAQHRWRDSVKRANYL